MLPKPTPPHRFNDFTMRSYAPVAYRHFREKFNIRPEDYLVKNDLEYFILSLHLCDILVFNQ
jgi:hypothetical protein